MNTPASPLIDLSAGLQSNAAPTANATPESAIDLSAGLQPQGASAPQGPTISANPQASEMPMFGHQWDSPENRVTMPLAKTLMAAHDKLREVESFTQEGRKEHPIQAKFGDIANRLEGFLFGNEHNQEAAIGSGKYGMLTNPVTAALIPGAEGASAADSAIPEAASAAKGGAAAGEEAPGIVKQVLKGKGVAQEPAKAAIRSAAGAGEDASIIEGNKTVLEDSLNAIKEKEKAAYKAIDDTAGFDVKATRKAIEDNEYKLKQPEITPAARKRLTTSVEQSKQAITDAEGRFSEKGIDPKAGDNLFKQRMAGEDFEKALVQHVSSDGKTIKVDGLLKAAQKLRFDEYGDRLEQFMGSKEKADEFMNKLEAAQEMGNKAVTKQVIAKWLGGITGVGLAGEATKHVVSMVQ